MPGYSPLTFGYYPPNLDEAGRAAPEGHVIASIRSKFPWVPAGTAEESGLLSMPLIIPPERYKQYDYYGGLFSSLWTQAHDVLAHADEIIVIGYSFPVTDVRSRDLFRKAFSERRSIPKVYVIDPAPQRVAETMRLDFGIPDRFLKVRAKPFAGLSSLPE
jgi:hypothetical protein